MALPALSPPLKPSPFAPVLWVGFIELGEKSKTPCHTHEEFFNLSEGQYHGTDAVTLILRAASNP